MSRRTKPAQFCCKFELWQKPYASKRIWWHFVSLWIKDVKRVKPLQKILRCTDLTYEGSLWVLVKIEAILIWRLFHPIFSHSNDLQPLLTSYFPFYEIYPAVLEWIPSNFLKYLHCKKTISILLLATFILSHLSFLLGLDWN